MLLLSLASYASTMADVPEVRWDKLSLLIEAVRQVWQGEKYLSPEVKAINEQAQGHVVALTEVERNILRMICDGMTNPQIAKSLNLSTETINWYRKRLLAKFGVKNAVSLATMVMKSRIL